jgi:hypothetical protein
VNGRLQLLAHECEAAAATFRKLLEEHRRAEPSRPLCPSQLTLQAPTRSCNGARPRASAPGQCCVHAPRTLRGCSADDWDCLCAYLAALTGGALSSADRAAALTPDESSARCWTAEDELHRACTALAAVSLTEEQAAAVCVHLTRPGRRGRVSALRLASVVWIRLRRLSTCMHRARRAPATAARRQVCRSCCVPRCAGRLSLPSAPWAVPRANRARAPHGRRERTRKHQTPVAAALCTCRAGLAQHSHGLCVCVTSPALVRDGDCVLCIAVRRRGNVATEPKLSLWSGRGCGEGGNVQRAHVCAAERVPRTIRHQVLLCGRHHTVYPWAPQGHRPVRRPRLAVGCVAKQNTHMLFYCRGLSGFLPPWPRRLRPNLLLISVGAHCCPNASAVVDSRTHAPTRVAYHTEWDTPGQAHGLWGLRLLGTCCASALSPSPTARPSMCGARRAPQCAARHKRATQTRPCADRLAARRHRLPCSAAL